MSKNGIIFDLKKFAIHDGPGIRTTVFFKGCPLNCWWCHNPEGLHPEPEEFNLHAQGNSSASPYSSDEVAGRSTTVEELMIEIEKDIVFYDQSGGGVTLSGGEPLMQDEFLLAVLKQCREKRIHTVLDTSGYATWEIFDKICDLVDLFLFDVKLASDEEHLKYTGIPNQLILRNLAALLERSKNVIVRIPLIPQITDTKANLAEIVTLLSKLNGIQGIDLLPYNKMGEEKFRRFSIDSKLGSLPVQPESELRKAASLFETAGYRVHVGG
jgi:pyruvate formate lyase activating enzyme